MNGRGWKLKKYCDLNAKKAPESGEEEEEFILAKIMLCKCNYFVKKFVLF